MASVEDDLEVEFVPRFDGEDAFEVAFGLGDGASVAEAPAFGEAVDVGIDWEAGDAEGLGHDDLGGFVSDAGELFEGFEVGWDLALVLVDEDLGELLDGAGFLWAEAAGADDVFDFSDAELAHVGGVICEGEEFWGDLVDPDVGALCGE